MTKGELSWDVRGLDVAAMCALIEWALEHAPCPVVVQWPVGLTLDIERMESHLSHPGLRMMLVDQEGMKGGRIELRSGLDGLPAAVLSFGGDSSLPVQLHSGPPPRQRLPDVDGPIGPTDIGRVRTDLENQGFESPSSDNRELPTSTEAAVLLACTLHPEGDEIYSNACEADHPLAAWISSPVEKRWQRWSRLSSRLDPGWLELMHAREVPTEMIPRIASNSGEDWAEQASEVLSDRLRQDPDLLLDLHPVSRGVTEPWLAGVVLHVSPWLPESFASDAMGWAWESWSAQPTPDLQKVLTSMAWLDERGLAPEEWTQTLEATRVDEGHPLTTWRALRTFSQNSSELTFDLASRILIDLPGPWWSGWSDQVLLTCLDSGTGRSLLSATQISWPSLLFKAPGESEQAPGLETEHPGVNISILDSLASNIEDLRDRNGPGVAPLLDVHDALKDVLSGNSPSTGRTHDGVGWLLRPLEDWPPFSTMMLTTGDPQVATLLAKRSSGHHDGLLFQGQQRLE